MIKEFILSLFALWSSAIFSQERALVSIIMDKAARGESTYEYTRELFTKPPSAALVEELGHYTISSPIVIKQTAYELIFQAGIRSSDIVRKECVRLLVENGLTDPEQIIKTRALGYLDEFAPSDFSDNARSRLASHLVSRTEGYLLLVKLAGRIDMTSVVPVLEQWLADASNPKEAWVVRLALARMGNETLKQYCLDKVKAAGMNDHVATYLLPDLAYIRHREAIKYMLTLVMNDDDSCSSYDPDSEQPVNCAYRVLEQVAPYVVGFPISLKPSGDLDSNDYGNALRVAREWIDGHLDSFEPKY